MTQSEAAFQLLATCVQDYAIYMLDTAGRISSWNIGAERIHGYSTSEIIGQHFSILFSADDQAEGRPAKELEQAREAGRFDCENQRRRKDGSLFMAQVGVIPFLDELGGLQGYAKIVLDISMRLRLEQRFCQVVQEAPYSMVMINRQGRIMLFNRQAEATFGYQQHEILGQPMESLVPVRFRQAHAILRGNFLLKPEARAMGAGRDLFGLRKDGGEFPVEIGLNPIETGEGTMVLAAIVDITTRKSAQQLLEAALREKTMLLNEIHHRVKNNLQVISSLLNMQANYASDESVKNILADSQARVRSMALIHQLLYEKHDYSRVDLGEYLRRLGQLLLSSFSSPAREVTLVIDAGVSQFYIELQRATPCGLLINELVTNAFKYAYPDTQGTVRVQLSMAEPQQALLVVSDHGVGLPDFAMGEKVKSMGLKLAPILADQIGASLSIHDNQPGARFEIRLPVMQEAAHP